MATSHFCNGEWRDGPVSACARHKKLSKKQTNVHGGVGEPGGKNNPRPSTGSDSSSSESTKSSSPKPSSPKSSGGSGSSSKDS